MIVMVLLHKKLQISTHLRENVMSLSNIADPKKTVDMIWISHCHGHQQMQCEWDVLRI